MPTRNRKTGLEQYYTNSAVADKCIDIILKYSSTEDKFLEPAGGTGTFINALRNRGCKDVISYDVEPKHKDIVKADFLDIELNDRNVVTITNPPFGRNNSLSIPFFNQAARFSRVIGFIVPRSWNKWSVQDRLHRNFHLISCTDIDASYENDAGISLAKNNKLKTVFQVWERRECLRELIIPKIENRHYITKTVPEDADISMTVFGRGCGAIKTEFSRVPNTTQMFLKVKDKSIISALKSIDFSVYFTNTAYIEALSIREIQNALNKHFDKL